MDLQTWLRQKRGRQTSLARHLGVKPPQVNDWISRDKPIPIRHMAAIEAYTGGEVTRQDMCPHDYQRIWPELRPSGVTKLAQAIRASMTKPSSEVV